MLTNLSIIKREHSIPGGMNYRGYEVRRFQAKKFARITYRIYYDGEFLDGGNKSYKDAKRRIDFLVEKGVWNHEKNDEDPSKIGRSKRTESVAG